jgi:hypothetical protein
MRAPKGSTSGQSGLHGVGGDGQFGAGTHALGAALSPGKGKLNGPLGGGSIGRENDPAGVG